MVQVKVNVFPGMLTQTIDNCLLTTGLQVCLKTDFHLHSNIIMHVSGASQEDHVGDQIALCCV